ncbi:Uncharacterised protein [Vibrio cholerae]|nr:Uncharacterised protein [Vibrio cholerae]
MNHKVTRFVNNDNVVIFIHNVQWQILRFPALFVFQFCLNGNHLATHHFGTRFGDDITIHGNLAFQQPLF